MFFHDFESILLLLTITVSIPILGLAHHKLLVQFLLIGQHLSVHFLCALLWQVHKLGLCDGT